MILRIEDVHASYGNIHALKGISLTVEQGEIALADGPLQCRT
jgi:ABC-type branched-subunit amino acid transport system ATPase component